MPDAKETEDDHVEDTLAEHQVLYNHQLLERVFSFLTLSSLKMCCLVCPFWAYEAGRMFPEVKIDLQTSHGFQKTEELFPFLRTHRFSCTFFISPLPSPWYQQARSDVSSGLESFVAVRPNVAHEKN
ncbi:hypothetical protein Fcan01_16157 [Folsomia candida]|uniref:Uncharacterized protein n=1 Tax=Folsomia candida TaxID=158441 RepID=A0A226DUF6_FOLCA|nr:hypothetical protein Fcan01_16157 [Folsomia candida]